MPLGTLRTMILSSNCAQDHQVRLLVQVDLVRKSNILPELLTLEGEGSVRLLFAIYSGVGSPDSAQCFALRV